MCRREIEISFKKRLKEVEDRFSGNQECVEQRFQADVLKFEQLYQSELKALADSHITQKLHWEQQLQEAQEKSEEQRRLMEETMEQERENAGQRWEKERQELESLYEEKTGDLVAKNQQLQNEVDELISVAQTKEIELSRQLNDLHNRLQESLQTRDELLAQSETKAFEAELLLKQTMEDFKQERETLLNQQSAQNERQISERIELLTERDALRRKIEELETLLRQAALDFALERKELLEDMRVMEKKIKDDLEKASEELSTERDVLRNRIKEPEVEFTQGSTPEEKKEESEENLTFCFAPPEICVNVRIQADSPSEELLCLLADEDGDVGTLQDAENNKNVEDEYDENVSDERADGQICLTENQEGEGHPEDPEATSCGGHDPDAPVPNNKRSNVESKTEEAPCEQASTLEAFEGVNTESGENEGALESCEEENRPQDVPASDNESPSHEDEPCHETVAEPSAPEEADDPDQRPPVDVEVTHQRWEVGPLTADARNDCAHDDLETPDEDADCEDGERSHLQLQVLYNTATEENVLLHEKVSLLQQKTDILEILLAHNSENVKTGQQALEENFSLKVKMLLVMEHVKELEFKALKMRDLHVKHEECMLENARLKGQNRDLEKRVWSLESGMSVFHDFQSHSKISLVDEISRMREENSKLSELLGEVEQQRQTVAPEQPAESPPDLSGQLEVNVRTATDLQGCCEELVKENADLRRAITELQDKSQTLNEMTRAHR